MDRLDDDSVDSITSIALEAVDRIGMIVASTPTGRRGKFYNMCNDKQTWFESHRSSTCNPEWSERAEREFKSILSEEGYKHEIDALFGEEVMGVFKKAFIERAIGHDDYDYKTYADYRAKRCIGVDFDKYGAASQIIVLEFDQTFIPAGSRLTSPKFRVVAREEIPMGDFTLDNATKKIIELNDKFKPDFIYCDRGYGGFSPLSIVIYFE